MEKTLNLMIEKLKTAFGENLKSVILYGSKATGEDTLKRSDYNVLIILNEAGFEQLKTLSPITTPWIKAGNPPPFFFSSRMFVNSADVFPIEFLEMKDHHKVLFGEDPLAPMEIHRTNLRHQCEFELKGKLLAIRQRYLVSQGKPDKVKDILISTISAILVIFRHVVRLSGQEPPDKKLEALEVFSRQAGFPPDVFVTIMNMKQGAKAAGKGDMERLMVEYLTHLERAARFVNDLEQ